MEEWKKDFFIASGEIRPFAKKIGDDNPLHNDRQIAIDTGFDDVIAPGAMIDVFITKTVLKKFPVVLILHREIKFLKPLYEGSVVQVNCTTIKEKSAIKKIAIEIRTTSNGLVAKGSCLLSIPKMRERQQKNQRSLL